ARRAATLDLLFPARRRDPVGTVGTHRPAPSGAQQPGLAAAAARAGVPVTAARDRRFFAGPAAACFAVALATCLLLAVFGSCGSRPEERKPSETATHGASASDLAAISRVHKEYVAAHNDSDADRLVALFTDDAILMPMDEPSLTGKKAIREHYEEFF